MRSQQDPYDIVPDEFLEYWDAESVEDALNKARRSPSSTAIEDRRRCPNCESLNIAPKSPRVTAHRQREDGKYWCESCQCHFDEPRPAIGEEVDR